MASQPQTAASSAPSVLEQALRRDRVIVIGAVLAIAAIAWAYTVYVAETRMGMGDGMGMGMAMADMRSWSAANFGLMFVMWAVMMVAMMAPSAAPMLLMFAAVNRKRRERQAPYVSTGIFLAGYVIVWTVFSVAATGGNWDAPGLRCCRRMRAHHQRHSGRSAPDWRRGFPVEPAEDACLKQCAHQWIHCDLLGVKVPEGPCDGAGAGGLLLGCAGR